MKKIALFVVVVLIAGFSGNVQAQKPFKKGIVTYTISYDGTWDAATLSQQPISKTVQILGKRSKVETVGMGFSMTEIVRGTDSTMFVILDIAAQGESFKGLKGYVKIPKEKLLEKLTEEKAPEIKYTEETKTISGYVCNKAEYITEDEYGDKVTTVVYYNEMIGGPELNFGSNFTGLKGFPMEYVIETEDGKITFSVTTVQTKKVKLKDVDFMIPDDYKELTEDEVNELFGSDE